MTGPVRRIAGWVCFWLGWAIVIGLLVVVFFRLVAWDEVRYFAVADAFGVLLYLPAWVVGIGAAVARKWALVAGAVLVVAAQLVFFLPELTAAEPVPAAAGHAFAFRLFDANVYQGNPSMAGYAAQIRSDRPALVTLEEASPADRSQLERAGALRALPDLFEIPRDDPRALLIASRYPLGPATVSSFDGDPYLTRTSLRLPGGTIGLWVVHTVAPLRGSYDEWYGMLQRVDQFISARRPGPLLVVGDFNATWGNRWFRAILGTGMTDAAAARGVPFEMTWSQQFFLLPPLVRIDHVLTSSSLAVTSIETGPGPGSDHRDLHAVVAVLPAARGHARGP
jgi:endonuclease/exonuclease/phosphatase (EEP) superfamily protein YafD